VGYAGGIVIHDLDLAVPAGTVHAVVGRNGSGKTTLISALAGLLPPRAGSVELDGRRLDRRPIHQVARAGVGLVPQGRRVFAHLTVAEHLRLAAGAAGAAGARRPGRGGWTARQILEFLPQLAARASHRGSQLSGGEQQLLAIARALLTVPRLLLLDEPFEGLSGSAARQIEDLVAHVAADGVAVLLAEQDLQRATALASELSILHHHSPSRGEPCPRQPTPAQGTHSTAAARNPSRNTQG
ncbi:MAG: ATP-binding cassette domain-containing protein, partial [Micromonosporaceae bacterium]|nr:ATP-binding cassette domain-containing protein [Micromonosporaceae bacterium]